MTAQTLDKTAWFYAPKPKTNTSDFSSIFCSSILVIISDVLVSNTIPPMTISFRI